MFCEVFYGIKNKNRQNAKNQTFSFIAAVCGVSTGLLHNSVPSADWLFQLKITSRLSVLRFRTGKRSAWVVTDIDGKYTLEVGRMTRFWSWLTWV